MNFIASRLDQAARQAFLGLIHQEAARIEAALALPGSPPRPSSIGIL
jgi:hypothetical protein